MLREHSPAPLDIPCIDEHGASLTLRAYIGRWVVVYFYPKDNTPGCTIEAEEFREHLPEFTALHAAVIGVSKDTCASHKRFIAKKNLTFTLIADTNHALMDAFGTWGERSFMGKTYMGTSRSTFLLDPTGTIVRAWETVRPAGHPADVLAALRAIQSERR